MHSSSLSLIVAELASSAQLTGLMGDSGGEGPWPADAAIATSFRGNGRLSELLEGTKGKASPASQLRAI